MATYYQIPTTGHAGKGTTMETVPGPVVSVPLRQKSRESWTSPRGVLLQEPNGPIHRIRMNQEGQGSTFENADSRAPPNHSSGEGPEDLQVCLPQVGVSGRRYLARKPAAPLGRNDCSVTE